MAAATVTATLIPRTPAPPLISDDVSTVGHSRHAVAAEIEEALKVMNAAEAGEAVEPVVEEPAAGVETEPAEGETPERGPDGKFLPKDGKAKADAEAAAKAKDAKPKDEPTAEEKAKEARNAEKFAAAAREGKRQRDERSALQAQLAAAVARADAAEQKEKAAADFLALKGNPKKLLEAAGHKPDDYLRQLIDGADEKPLTPEEKQAADIEARVDALLAKREAEAAQKAAEKAAADEKAAAEMKEKWVTNCRATVRALVTNDPEKFQALAKTQNFDGVLRLVEGVWRNGMDEDGHKYAPGTSLPLDKAAEMVEEWLIEEAVKYVGSLSKVMKRLAPSGDTTANTTAEARTQPLGTRARDAAPNAISNRKAAPIATPSEDGEDLDDEALMKKALGAMR